MRTLMVCAFCATVLIIPSGCGGSKNGESYGPSGSLGVGTGTGTGTGEGTAKTVEAETAPKAAKTEEATTATKTDKQATAKPQPEPPRGLLTAGSFDDTLYPSFLPKFAQRFGQSFSVGNLPSKLLGRPLTITVKGKDNAPLGNAPVDISNGKSTIRLITRSDGRVIFLSSWDNLQAEQELTVTVLPPNGSGAVTQKVSSGESQCTISLPEVVAPLPKNLDLVIVLDTTGSMSDELEYLKSEIKSIADRVQKKFPNIQQRFALVLYRDEGDAYVVRSFPFTNSVMTFQNHLAAQSANGGGDYPEAVHRGLEEALNLQWQTADTARVLFLIGDAPPHSQFVNQTMAAADALRKKGVVIYPVAASGYAEEMELVMRSCALLTGGQFLFLTDDSGIGNSHAEPHIPYYHVQRLNDLMIRMIAGELAGKRLDPVPEEIIRTTGQPIIAGQQK